MCTLTEPEELSTAEAPVNVTDSCAGAGAGAAVGCCAGCDCTGAGVGGIGDGVTTFVGIGDGVATFVGATVAVGVDVFTVVGCRVLLLAVLIAMQMPQSSKTPTSVPQPIANCFFFDNGYCL